jgi:hypothetical protein
MAKPPKVSTTGALPTAGGLKSNIRTTRMGDIGFDPRFDTRTKEQPKLNALTTTVEKTASSDVPEVYLPDYEGYGYVSSMSDRTAGGGNLVDINGIKLKRPVGLQAGQSYMFENPGQVWAAGDIPARAILLQAAAAKALTGKDPLHLPWRMAPTGSDFSTMTGETMLSFAESNLGSKAKRSLDKQIKQFIPDWKGVDSPDSIEQFRGMPDATRKAVKAMMDRDFRNEGGLGIGEARLAIADPNQLSSPEGYIMNVGRIFADKPLIEYSGHASYPRGIPGEGIGRLKEERSLFELYPKTFPEEKGEKVIRPLLLDPTTALGTYGDLPDAVTARNIPDPRQPRQSDTRALQMKPYYGILTEEILRKMGFAEGGLVSDTLEGMVRSPEAAKMLDMDLARLALERRQGMMDGGQPRQPTHLETKNVPFEQWRNTIGMNQGGDTLDMAGGGKVRIMHGSPVKITPTNERPLHVTTDSIYATKRGSDKLGQLGIEGPPMVNRYDIPEERLLRMDETPYTAEQVNMMRRYWNRLPADTGMTGEEIYDLLSANKQPMDRLMPGITEAGGFWGYQRPATGTGGRDEWFKITKPENLEVVKKHGGAVHPSPEEMLIEMMERGYGRN